MRVRDDILRMQARLEELRPLVEEARELEEFLDALKTAGIAGVGDSAPRRIPLETRKRQILVVLEATPGVRIGALARMLGLTSQRVVQIVNKMVAEGLVERQEGGGLKITAD